MMISNGVKAMLCLAGEHAVPVRESQSSLHSLTELNLLAVVLAPVDRISLGNRKQDRHLKIAMHKIKRKGLSFCVHLSVDFERVYHYPAKTRIPSTAK